MKSKNRNVRNERRNYEMNRKEKSQKKIRKRNARAEIMELK
jgi:hypothetical protein